MATPKRSLAGGISLTWMFSRHVGAGVGCARFALNVDANKSSFEGRLKANYSGLQIYLMGSFWSVGPRIISTPC
jgi:hypothetical protein